LLPRNLIGNWGTVGVAGRLLVIAQVEKAQALLAFGKPKETAHMFDGPRTAPISSDALGGCGQPQVLYGTGCGGQLFPLRHGPRVTDLDRNHRGRLQYLFTGSFVFLW